MGLWSSRPEVLPANVLTAINEAAIQIDLKREHPIRVKHNREKTRFLRFVCISDTHQLHRNITIPEGDVLIHSGDWTNWNTSSQANLLEFDDWLGSLPHRHKIVIAGNHELCLNRQRHRDGHLKNAIYLENSFTEIQGIRIFGSPVNIRRGITIRANAFTQDSDGMKAIWKRLERETTTSSSSSSPSLSSSSPQGEGLDILITHVPPCGVLDSAPGQLPQGCPHLLSALLNVQPKVHVFGHIHETQGACWLNLPTLNSILQSTSSPSASSSNNHQLDDNFETLCINAAQKNNFHPIVFDYYY